MAVSASLSVQNPFVLSTIFNLKFKTSVNQIYKYLTLQLN